ncbi:MAG: PilT/PilU family type 4a pilus ATPase [Phycisphaerae bacterium]|nr:PilT/PilU family type 4a pilus ATPase [Phycisphaerae bacterium]
MNKFPDLLSQAFKAGATDLHIIVGHPPLLRINTILGPLADYSPVTDAEAEQIVKFMLKQSCDDVAGGADEVRWRERWEQFLRNRDMDLSVQVGDLGRYRVNAHFQRGSIAVALRAIPNRVPTFTELHLPDVIERFANLPRGLVLITGETGSGKSTTLASMVDYIARRYHYHIITIEDPIEYILESHKSAVEQRELGLDVPSFTSALKYVLRQDPDVILVGEMRDLETIALALTAAETGHLVLSTLHTNGTAASVERIIDVFPAAQQGQVRSQLANTLQGVATQVLLPRADEPGLIPATEVLVITAAVRACIRENRLHEIRNIIETNLAAGMHALDRSIKELILNGNVSTAAAIAKADNPEQLAQTMQPPAWQTY